MVGEEEGLRVDVVEREEIGAVTDGEPLESFEVEKPEGDGEWRERGQSEL